MTHDATTHFAITADIDGIVVETDVFVTVEIVETYRVEGCEPDEYPVPEVTETPVVRGSYVDNNIWLVDGDDEVCLESGPLFDAAEGIIIGWVIGTNEGRALVSQSLEDDYLSAAERWYETR